MPNPEEYVREIHGIVCEKLHERLEAMARQGLYSYDQTLSEVIDLIRDTILKTAPSNAAWDNMPSFKKEQWAEAVVDSFTNLRISPMLH